MKFNSDLFFLLIVNASVLLVILFSKMKIVFFVEIGGEGMQIKYFKLFQIKKTNLDVTKIHWSYKLERIGRISDEKVLRIYAEDGNCFKISAEFFLWEEDEVEEVFKCLESLNDI